MSTERETEARRDLEASPGTNKMGGETFTVITSTYYTTPAGQQKLQTRSVKTNQPFLPVRS